MPPSATKSSFAIGVWNPLTDAFTQALDLNDGATFAIMNKGLSMPQPDKSIIESGNLRTAGVTVPRWQYKARHITVEVWLRNTASTTALLTNIRALLAAIENPPYCIRLALPGATQYSYADVLAVKHDIPSDPQTILAGAITKIHIDFECRVGLRGDRITLQNLAPNPGFDQPSGPAVPVFNDTFANGNAYTFVAGSGGVASSVLSINAGGRVTFGSPAWGAINLWQVRWRWVTSLTATFYLHYTDSNNSLFVQVNSTGTSVSLIHRIAGANTTIASASISLTTVSFYWFLITQFPDMHNDPSYLNVVMIADTGGAPGGATLATLSGPAVSTASDKGVMALEAGGANLQVGGAFSNVNLVELFGPGGWSFTNPSVTAGAWEQTAANTYSGGAVTSLGALRMDAPPTGAWDAKWYHYSGGSPTGTWAAPCGPSQTLGAAVWVKTSGLGASASIQCDIHEFDASGTELRAGTLAGVTGNQASWTQMAGSYTTGAGCVYVAIHLRAHDSTSGSASGIVWFDNAQLWNQTATGMTSMPWCALRGVRSPSQLVVSGVQGDMPAPTQISIGTFLSSWPTNGTITLMLGRKQTTLATAQLVAASIGAYPTAYTPVTTALLDSGSWSGYYIQANVGSSGWNAFPGMTPTAADVAGVYHLIARVRSAESSGNLPSVGVRVVTGQQTDSGLKVVSGTDIVGQSFGPWVYPLTAANTWQVVDAGQALLPPFPQGALTNPANLFLTPRTQWQDTSGSSANGNTDWQALLPIDGSLLMASLNNPGNSSGAVTNSWLWVYADGLLLNRGGQGDIAAWTLSTETSATPNPANGASGVGNSGTGSLNVNPAADPCLTLDPAQDGANGVTGVNQMVAILADQAGSVYPVFTEISYSPLYLYPR